MKPSYQQEPTTPVVAIDDTTHTGVAFYPRRPRFYRGVHRADRKRRPDVQLVLDAQPAAGKRWRLEERHTDGTLLGVGATQYTDRGEALDVHANLVHEVARLSGRIGYAYGPHGDRRLVVTEVK